MKRINKTPEELAEEMGCEVILVGKNVWLFGKDGRRIVCNPETGEKIGDHPAPRSPREKEKVSR